MFIAIVFAIPIGLLAATKRGTVYDGGIMMFAIVGQSMPSFWLGIMFMLYVGLHWQILPLSGHIPLIVPLFDGDFQTVYHNLPAQPGISSCLG